MHTPTPDSMPVHRPDEAETPVQPDGIAFRVLWTPAVFTGILALLALTPRVQANLVLERSFWASALVLLLWQVALSAHLVRGRSSRRLETAFRPQHYIQAMVQLAVFGYWGWYWRPVYDMGILIAAQLAFAYAFGMLLAWSRGERYVLGFGPFPIILSINLFLWFKDDWFYLQFLMVAVGFLGKEFVRWHREGRQVHVFNPSAFSLGLFSLVLIATGTTDLTWGTEIATTLTLAPRIYLALFLLGLVVMYFFSITLVAGTAAAVLFGLSAAYSTWTGIPYFIDSEIPAAVFLGLHLLITDPSTSPRTRLGKAAFGALYGIGVFSLYAVLGAAGAPTFYDKLLCVPLLNLSVRGIDASVARLRARATDPSSGGGWAPARLNLAHMAAWILFFGAMTATGRTDGRHPGDSVPFWVEACAEGLPKSCQRLLQIEASYCGDSAGWACNELGVHYTAGIAVEADSQLARSFYARACELRFQAGCLNLLTPTSTIRSVPRTLDLRLMLREGGLNLMEMPESALYARACAHDWRFACEGAEEAS